MIYAINAETLGLSEYSHTGDAELIEHKGKTIFRSSSGLDEQVPGVSPISFTVGTIKTGKLTLAGNQEFNIPKVSFGAEGQGTVVVEYVTQEYGQLHANPSDIRDLAELDQHEMTLETHQAARSYQFTLTLDSPGTKLESLDAYVNPVRHKRRG